MFEEIDPRSAVPLYAQIAGRLRLAIASGELRSGDGLSSVRELAARLRINPATVVQAYRELEQEGFVEMRQGAGTFVSDLVPRRRGEERAKEATRLVRQLFVDASRIGIPSHAVSAAFSRELKRISK